MRHLGFIALGIVLAVAESLLAQLLPSNDLAPDLVLPLVIYTGLLGLEAWRGATIAFVVGYFVDTLQPGSPICMNMFVLVSLFLVSRMLAARLLLAGTLFHTLLAFMGSVASGLIIVGLRAVFEMQIGGWQSLAVALATRALATAVAAPFVFALARQIDTRRIQRRDERLVR